MECWEYCWYYYYYYFYYYFGFIRNFLLPLTPSSCPVSPLGVFVVILWKFTWKMSPRGWQFFLYILKFLVKAEAVCILDNLRPHISALLRGCQAAVCKVCLYYNKGCNTNSGSISIFNYAVAVPLEFPLCNNNSRLVFILKDYLYMTFEIFSDPYPKCIKRGVWSTISFVCCQLLLIVLLYFFLQIFKD